MQTPKIYGQLPKVIGYIDLNPTEMMFWLYCPVKTPSSVLMIPDNLTQYQPLIEAVKDDLTKEQWADSYIYITAKTLYVTPQAPGNRPGWHSDGFLSDDLNYIWYDANPTVFWEDGKTHSFTADHTKSLDEMFDLCENSGTGFIFTYPVKTLLKLDQTALHKVDTEITAGVRTFVKISVSRNRYALKGNSVNHDLAWIFGKDYYARGDVRNDPRTP